MVRVLTTQALRDTFIDFFTAKGATHYPSASLVPENDPTILFTVAGMAQFKDMFLGRGTHSFSRAVTCQKVIRTNDIMEVGRTPRHHTFFEMLGNFSFNDYFKREAITWAWEFLTEVLDLPADRLSVSVHTLDDEAYDIWAKEIGIPAERIFRMGDADNFWPASAPAEGPLGPGGCCSEIFWDFQNNDVADDNLTTGSDRFVEVWNLVFPQYNVVEPQVDGRYTLENLGLQNIDTGMGLERIACIIQGKTNNFDTDEFQQIIQVIADASGVAYVEDAQSDVDKASNTLLRRICDHVRAVTFCIMDNARPSNVGRGYVVRRLIRRATLDVDKLGIHETCLYRFVQKVVDVMSGAYPDLLKRQDLCEQTLEAEESGFRTTLRKGLDMLNKCIAQHTAAKLQVFSGDDAFELVTTHGFPRELIDELLDPAGLRVDGEQFDRRWQDFVNISRSKSVDVFTSTALQEAKPRLGATPFVGYTADIDAKTGVLETQTTITLLEHDGVEVATAVQGAKIRCALSCTPFYAEGGGQMGDSGIIEGSDFTIAIHDTQKDEDLFIHSGEVIAGTATASAVTARVDSEKRAASARHHSATHLLHSALCATLGDHIEQQGSHVSAEALRFDYNHPQALTKQDLATLEASVTAAIAAGHVVDTKELSIDEARGQGAKAQFGEKYGATVRVVRMGDASIELCGGCHVRNTADIQAFHIIKDEASSAGVRRISALAGALALQIQDETRSIAETCATLLQCAHIDADALQACAKLLKIQPVQVAERVQVMLTEAAALCAAVSADMVIFVGTALERIHALQKDMKRLRQLAVDQAAQQAMTAIDGIIAAHTDVAGTPVYVGSFERVDAAALKQVGEAMKERFAQEQQSYCIILGSNNDGKAALLVAVSADVLARGVKAGAVVAVLAKKVGGGGGGRPDFAQAGGKNGAAVAAVLADAAAVVAGMVG